MNTSLKRRIDGLGDAAAGMIDRFLTDERFLKGFCWGVVFCAGLYFAPVLINLLTR